LDKGTGLAERLDGEEIMTTPKPINLMIAGAQKAGTTSLLRYLGTHPDICVHEQIEMTYFALDEEYQRGYRWAYEKYFCYSNDLPSFVFAKNVDIMNLPEAARRLKEHNPDVHIVTLLRNPVERAYSAYWFARSKGREKLKSFEEAIIAEPERLKKDPYKWRHNAYLDKGNYCKHLEMLSNLFGKEKLHIFLDEDFKRDPLQVCNKIVNLFSLDPMKDISVVQKKHNTSAMARSDVCARAINRIVREPNAIKRACPHRS